MSDKEQGKTEVQEVQDEEERECSYLSSARKLVANLFNLQTLPTYMTLTSPSPRSLLGPTR